jgi:hypothetical protein
MDDSFNEKVLELKFRLSNDYKLKLEYDLRVKKIEAEIQIFFKKNELALRRQEYRHIVNEIEIQRQKNMQIFMEKGYDLNLHDATL